jgi:hypothetical protein
MMKALFLGAGASYEVGMPLVLEFTNILKRVILKRINTNLFNFKGDEELKSKFISLLMDPDMNYEQVVMQLEKLYLNCEPEKRDSVHGVVIQLIETIQLLLLEEQSLTKNLLAEKIKCYYGLTEYVSKTEPTFVYSLNHDVVFEEICSFLKIPLADGFYNDSKKFGHIAPFASISSGELEEGKLNFFEGSSQGINLIKLHGSLDIFAIEDMNYFIKARGLGKYIGAHIDAVLSVEKANNIICDRDQYRITNELTVEDETGEVQFLRRSLLSGGHKFKSEMSQIAPIAFLEYFNESLSEIHELTIIGYSFGDLHINNILEEWTSTKGKLIKVFDPYMSKIPECICKNKTEVKVYNGGFTDFCLMWDSSKESYSTKSMRDALNIVRNDLKLRREK